MIGCISMVFKCLVKSHVKHVTHTARGLSVSAAFLPVAVAMVTGAAR